MLFLAGLVLFNTLLINGATSDNMEAANVQVIDLNIGEGSDIELPCKGLTKGATWQHKGYTVASRSSNIFADSRKIITEDFSIKITEVIAKDAGKYTCKDSENNVISWYQVNVIDMPTIDCSTCNITVAEGESVTFTCVTNSDSKLMKWFTNVSESGTAIENSYHIKHALPAHNGIYTCSISNGYYDPVTAEISLIVLKAPEIIHLQVRYIPFQKTLVIVAGIRSISNIDVFIIVTKETFWHESKTQVAAGTAYHHHRIIMDVPESRTVYNVTVFARGELTKTNHTFQLCAIPPDTYRFCNEVDEYEWPTGFYGGMMTALAILISLSCINFAWNLRHLEEEEQKEDTLCTCGAVKRQ